MMRPFLQKTHFEGLVRVGVDDRKAQDSWHQINAYLTTTLGTEYAALFAEPEFAFDGTVDWYSSTDGTPEPLSALSDDDAEILVSDFLRIYGAIKEHAAGLAQDKSTSRQRLGAILEGALLFPVSRSSPPPLYRVGHQPVLVNWGTKSDVAAGSQDPLRDFVMGLEKRPPPPATSENLAAPAPITVLPAAPAQVWLAPALGWLVFAILLIILFLMLLAPCGVRGLTGYRPCPGTLLVQQIDPEIAELTAELRAIETALTEAPVCDAPTATVPDQEKTDADQRRTDAGGKSGEVNITLTWNNTSDLDLHVDCGSAEIWHRNEVACSGELDVDKNARGTPFTTEPVENVVFLKAPSGSRLKIDVKNFEERSGGFFSIAGSTRYRVEVTVNGKREVFDGVVSHAERKHVTTINIP